MKRKFLRFLSYILVATLASAATLAMTQQSGRYRKLAELEALIARRYVDPVDTVVIEDAAAYAMVESLGDRWSYYIPASEYASHVEQMENAYVGVGITIVLREDETGFDIVQVNAGGSAEEAGIRAGDILYAIEGQSTAGMTTADARNLVRGKEGTQVQMTILRNGQEITFSVTRRQVQTPVATGKLLDGSIGLVTIVNFDDRCAQETLLAIEALQEAGMEKLILDVRNNPGGYAHEMVRILDYLLPEGELFRAVDSSGRENVDTSNADHLDIPMAVLVNADSYSAAEFFAAALQEYEAAVVVGEQTSGKGYFQNTLQLSDGSAVGLSVGKYYTPKGVSLEGVGIQPDIPVSVDEQTDMQIYYGQLDAEEDPQIRAAIDALQ